MLKSSLATANGVLNGTGLIEQFNGACKLYIFAGPVPAAADDALDMVSAHTECAIITDNDAGTALNFETPAAGALGKQTSQVWSGTVATDGFQGALTTITPTFYRICATGDNGRAAANTSTGYRIQGTCGGPNSGADLELGVTSLTEGNVQPIGAFSITLAR